MKTCQRDAGYVALIAVLVMGAIATAVATLLLGTATDASREKVVTQQSAQARSLATACGEEALQQIQTNRNYSGTGNLTLATGSCTYTVTNQSGTATIDTSANVGNVVRSLRIGATIGALNISITSWQEVSL